MNGFCDDTTHVLIIISASPWVKHGNERAFNGHIIMRRPSTWHALSLESCTLLLYSSITSPISAFRSPLTAPRFRTPKQPFNSTISAGMTSDIPSMFQHFQHPAFSVPRSFIGSAPVSVTKARESWLLCWVTCVLFFLFLMLDGKHGSGVGLCMSAAMSHDGKAGMGNGIYKDPCSFIIIQLFGSF